MRYNIYWTFLTSQQNIWIVISKYKIAFVCFYNFKIIELSREVCFNSILCVFRLKNLSITKRFCVSYRLKTLRHSFFATLPTLSKTWTSQLSGVVLGKICLADWSCVHSQKKKKQWSSRKFGIVLMEDNGGWLLTLFIR